MNPPSSNPQPEIAKEILPNGLTVLLVPCPGVRVMTVDVWVSTGSADEPPPINGVSHFLEHMLFKGTARFGAGEIDRAIEGVGGLLNAATSHDVTHYHVTAASPHLPIAMDVIADMVRNAALDAEELDRERGVIIEEYYIKQDDPHGLLWEELYLRAFERGPYRLPVLGVPDTLKAIGPAEITDYYRRHYCPENMLLMVVGDMEPAEALKRARGAFDGFDRPFRPMLDKKTLQTTYAAPAEHVLEKELNETYGVIGFPAPGFGEPREAYGLDVLQFVLGGGNASILNQEIKEKRRLASSIHAGLSTSRHPDLFYVFYTCEEEKRPALETAVFDQLDRLAQSPPAPEVLNRAKKLLTNAHAFSLETTGGQSSAIGYYYTVSGSVDFEKQYAEGVNAVTAQQVQELAGKWLATRASASRVVIRPKNP